MMNQEDEEEDQEVKSIMENQEEYESEEEYDPDSIENFQQQYI